MRTQIQQPNSHRATPITSFAGRRPGVSFGRSPEPPKTADADHETERTPRTVGSHETASTSPPPTRPAHHIGAIPTFAAPPIRLQAKLTVGEPDDAYEQEAEQIAERVMRMEEPRLRRACSCGGTCPKCRNGTSDHEDEKVRPSRVRGNDAGIAVAPPIVDEVIGASGTPLDTSTRTFFESRFDHDFGNVRVHTDGRASESARDVGALAYTVGNHIAFGHGQFQPGTSEGRKLLAHELTHVVQQGGGNQRLSRVPTEGGVREGRYSFSTNCGWIDWSHADPSLSRRLIDRVRTASDALRAGGSGAPASTGDVTSPTMTSAVPHVGVVLSSASLNVRLLRALSNDEVLAVALSIFKKLSIVFETQQAWTDLIGQSSFAQEDLPSNLISFYMAARGYDRDQINNFCGSLSTDDSLAEYQRDHDFERNRLFSPVGASGSWPTELSNIDDSQAAALYEIRGISATQGTSSFSFCPIYRIEGTIGETDLFIVSVGGAHFTASDNVRVVPTYRAYEAMSGSYGHVTYIEVEPYSQPDFFEFHQHNILWPLFVPSPILVCLSSQGNPV
jgi:hypothetical protein